MARNEEDSVSFGYPGATFGFKSLERLNYTGIYCSAERHDWLNAIVPGARARAELLCEFASFYAGLSIVLMGTTRPEGIPLRRGEPSHINFALF